MRRAHPVAMILVFAVLGVTCKRQGGHRKCPVTRVSVSSSGVQADAYSSSPSISADGRFVVFESGATNLALDRRGGTGKIFVHDRYSGATKMVSVNSAGAEANSSSGKPSISADGRFVAFWSHATNLVPGDTNGCEDIFVHDRRSHLTTRVSVGSGGREANQGCHDPCISADGRFVVFDSTAVTLVPRHRDAPGGVFVRDVLRSETERVSLGTGGGGNPVVSADGRFVAFSSAARGPGPVQGTNIFICDRSTQAMKKASVSARGGVADGISRPQSISADGRFVAFASAAANLVPGDTNDSIDIFVWDCRTDKIERVSTSSSGEQADSGSEYASVSADGRFVVFESGATNLVSGDTNGKGDIFVRDRRTGTTERASVTASGGEANGHSSFSSISADGRFVAFESEATNLVPGDTNRAWDVFIAPNPLAP